MQSQTMEQREQKHASLYSAEIPAKAPTRSLS